MAKSIADGLKAAGLGASRASITLLEPEALTLIRDKEHPLYDARVEFPVDVDSPLYADILARGVEKPIEVRKNGVDKKNVPILQVIDGRQRVQILQHINKHLPKGELRRKLPVNFVTGDDKEMVLRGLSSNLLRREETPFTKALKAKKAQALGCGLEEIARACNLKSTKPVEEMLLVLNFIPEVQEAFNGELPASAIKTFSKVPREEQKAALSAVRGVGAKSTKQREAAVKSSREGTEYVEPKSTKAWSPTKVDAFVAKLETQRKEASGVPNHYLRGAIDALKVVTGRLEKLETDS